MKALSDNNDRELLLSAERTKIVSRYKKYPLILFCSLFFLFILIMQFNTISSTASTSHHSSTSYLFNDKTIDSFIFAIAIESIFFILFVNLTFIEIPKIMVKTWYRIALSSLITLMIIINCRLVQFNLYLNFIYISIAVKITILFFDLSRMEQITQRDLFGKSSVMCLIIVILMLIIGCARWLYIIPGIPGLEVLGLGVENKSLTFGDFIDFFILNASFDTFTIIVFVISAIITIFSYNNARIKRYTSFHYLRLRSKSVGWHYLLLFYCALIITGLLLIGFQMITNSTYLLFFTICCCGVTAIISSENYITSGNHPVYSYLTALSTTLALISFSIYFSGNDLGIIALITLALPYIVMKFTFLQKEEKPLIRNY